MQKVKKHPRLFIYARQATGHGVVLVVILVANKIMVMVILVGF
jgi:hypothetical protein